MIIFTDYIKLFKIVNIKTDCKTVAEGSDDLNWLDNKLADEIIDRDEIAMQKKYVFCKRQFSAKPWFKMLGTGKKGIEKK